MTDFPTDRKIIVVPSRFQITVARVNFVYYQTWGEFKKRIFCRRVRSVFLQKQKREVKSSIARSLSSFMRINRRQLNHNTSSH